MYKYKFLNNSVVEKKKKKLNMKGESRLSIRTRQVRISHSVWKKCETVSEFLAGIQWQRKFDSQMKNSWIFTTKYNENSAESLNWLELFPTLQWSPEMGWCFSVQENVVDLGLLFSSGSEKKTKQKTNLETEAKLTGKKYSVQKYII